MIALMDAAKAEGADFIVYPELALTTFFPRWYHDNRAEADAWFEASMPARRPHRSSTGPSRTAWPCRSAMPSSPPRPALQHLDPRR